MHVKVLKYLPFFGPRFFLSLFFSLGLSCCFCCFSFQRDRKANTSDCVQNVISHQTDVNAMLSYALLSRVHADEGELREND